MNSKGQVRGTLEDKCHRAPRKLGELTGDGGCSSDIFSAERYGHFKNKWKELCILILFLKNEVYFAFHPKYRMNSCSL